MANTILQVNYSYSFATLAPGRRQVLDFVVDRFLIVLLNVLNWYKAGKRNRFIVLGCKSYVKGVYLFLMLRSWAAFVQLSKINYFWCMDNSIQNAKLELIQWLTTLEDSSLIQKIMDLRKSQTQDLWDEISESEKKSIEQGLMDAQRGKLKPNSEAEKIYGRWL